MYEFFGICKKIILIFNFCCIFALPPLSGGCTKAGSAAVAPPSLYHNRLCL